MKGHFGFSSKFFLVCLSFFSLFLSPVWSQPQVSLLINGAKNALVHANEFCSLYLYLDPRSAQGQIAYWYLVESGPQGLFTYDVYHNVWQRGFSFDRPSYIGPLINLNGFYISFIPENIGKASGSYHYYFGVAINGDPLSLYFDSAQAFFYQRIQKFFLCIGSVVYLSFQECDEPDLTDRVILISEYDECLDMDGLFNCFSSSFPLYPNALFPENGTNFSYKELENIETIVNKCEQIYCP